ncbi:SGNH/GDSL hydrolase family protein [Kaistia dalseonensis]|uniref:Lysophospholipase L1-like esterase n=1 Tax=Kaistia dalseonensis TaxID=410840 RepID=A0ABU0H5U8_9HYPH|nr:SGNH/GDSL hydrolase family protein [Kaistia dalseonensis]MCX5495110.1 SGNH/GDSL hydrolase family protein [Kaistia dalseonensis]MDQ0437692.1 lysophospholipase L1-like esterase [Kaistia dalseonensis]
MLVSLGRIGQIGTPARHKAGAPLAERIVATRGRTAQGEQTVFSSRSIAVGRERIIIGEDCAAIKVRYLAWIQLAADPGERPITNAVTIQAVGLEKADGSLTVPMLFAGAATALLDPTSTDKFMDTDYLPATALGLSKFSRGEEYFIRTQANCGATNSKYPVNNRLQQPGEGNVVYAVGTSGAPTAYGTGAVTTGTGIVSTHSVTPQAVFGRTSGRVRAYVALGDSLTDETNDANTTDKAGRGFAQRAALDASGLNPLGNVVHGIGGSTLKAFATNTSLRSLVYQNVDTAVLCLGTNDVSDVASTPENMRDYARQVRAQLAAGGVKRIIQLLPATRVTAATATLAPADQVVYDANWDTGGLMDQFRAAVAPDVGSQHLDVLLDARDYICDASDRRKFASGMVHTDGLHWVAAAHVLIAQAVRAAILG